MLICSTSVETLAINLKQYFFHSPGVNVIWVTLTATELKFYKPTATAHHMRPSTRLKSSKPTTTSFEYLSFSTQSSYAFHHDSLISKYSLQIASFLTPSLFGF